MDVVANGSKESAIVSVHRGHNLVCLLGESEERVSLEEIEHIDFIHLHEVLMYR